MHLGTSCFKGGSAGPSCSSKRRKRKVADSQSRLLIRVERREKARDRSGTTKDRESSDGLRRASYNKA